MLDTVGVTILHLVIGLKDQPLGYYCSTTNYVSIGIDLPF